MKFLPSIKKSIILKSFFLISFVFLFKALSYGQGHHKYQKDNSTKNVKTQRIKTPHVPKSPLYLSLGLGAVGNGNIGGVDLTTMIGLRHKNSIIAIGTGFRSLVEYEEIGKSSYSLSLLSSSGSSSPSHPNIFLPIALEYKYYLWNKSASPFLSLKAAKYKTIQARWFSTNINGKAWSMATSFGFRLASKKNAHISFKLGYEVVSEYDKHYRENQFFDTSAWVGDLDSKMNHLLKAQMAFEF